MGQTGRQTDGRKLDHYSMITARRDQYNKLIKILETEMMKVNLWIYKWVHFQQQSKNSYV